MDIGILQKSSLPLVKEVKIVKEMDPCWQTENMRYREYPSDVMSVRMYVMDLLQNAPVAIQNDRLHRGQIAEIFKNAMICGNRLIVSKKIRVFWGFSTSHGIIKTIVEDDGGLVGLSWVEHWNAFYRRRCRRLEMEGAATMKGTLEMFSYTNQLQQEKSFKTEQGKLLGGNGLCSLVEYWNGGFLYTQTRDGKGKVCAIRRENDEET